MLSRLPITEIRDCEGARSRARKILTPSPQLNYIAIFGDSNPLNISEWVPLINTTAPTNFYDQVMTTPWFCETLWCVFFLPCSRSYIYSIVM